MPDPPTRFSTITGWPSLSCRSFAIARATTSDRPPAGYGTTSVTVRLG